MTFQILALNWSKWYFYGNAYAPDKVLTYMKFLRNNLVEHIRISTLLLKNEKLSLLMLYYYCLVKDMKWWHMYEFWKEQMCQIIQKKRKLKYFVYTICKLFLMKSHKQKCSKIKQDNTLTKNLWPIEDRTYSINYAKVLCSNKISSLNWEIVHETSYNH